MGFNHYRAVRCGRSISSSGYDVERISSKSGTFLNMVPGSYDGQDAREFSNAIQQFQRELNYISSESKRLGNEIINTANEIKREEEEKQRIAREARLKSILGT